jgi:hypothetical protein
VRDPETGFIEYQPPEPVATGDIPVVPTWLHVKGRCCKDCEVPIIARGRPRACGDLAGWHLPAGLSSLYPFAP